jgi:hypothetical protein
MDLLRASRDIEAAFADVVRLGHDVDWSEHRHVAGQRALRDLESESASPLRDALAAWIAWLTVMRVSQPAIVRAAKARVETEATVRLERDARVDLRAAITGMLAARTPGEARAYFAALADFGALQEPERTLRETRAEAFHRLGIDDVPEHFLRVKRASILAAARQFLVETADLAREVTRAKNDAWPLALDRRLARAATEGWPSRLTWRTAAELLPGFDMRATLAKDPPRALGASSFARALQTIGETFHAMPTTADPFVVRITPLSAAARRTGLVFASVVAEKTFHARVFGLSSGRAADQARTLAAAALLDARFTAMRVALADASRDHEETTALGLGAPLVRSLDGVWPARRDEDFAALLALFASLATLRTLRAREGDDWFRNPRAFGALRELSMGEIALDDDAPRALARAFEEILA